MKVHGGRLGGASWRLGPVTWRQVCKKSDEAALRLPLASTLSPAWPPIWALSEALDSSALPEGSALIDVAREPGECSVPPRAVDAVGCWNLNVDSEVPGFRCACSESVISLCFEFGHCCNKTSMRRDICLAVRHRRRKNKV